MALASSEILVQSKSVHQVAQRHQGKAQKEGWATAFRGHKFSPTGRCKPPPFWISTRFLYALQTLTEVNSA